MSNLFVICGTFTLTLAQCLVSSVLREEENHIWLYTYPQFSQIRPSFNALLIPELWSTIWHVNFEAKERYILRRELFRSPYNYHLTLSKSERRMRKKLDEIKTLSHLYTSSDRRTALPRFLHRESQRRNYRFIYLEDGLGAYKPLPTIKRSPKRLYRGHIAIKSMISDMLTTAFLYLTNRQEIYSPDHNVMTYDEAYLMFPKKCPIDEFPGAIIRDLSPFVTTSQINELKQRANLSEKINWSPQNEGQNSALFLSQSLVEDNLLKMEHQVDLTTRILEQLARQYERVFYKPHPRDLPEKTTAILSSVPFVQLFPEKLSLPIEMMFSKDQIKACYGICSSALVYLTRFSDVKTYSLFPWMVRELERMGVNALTFKRHFEAHQAQFEQETIWLEEIANE